jgi:hypothetical protein
MLDAPWRTAMPRKVLSFSTAPSSFLPFDGIAKTM